jgi:cysteine-rich repeat protein
MSLGVDGLYSALIPLQTPGTVLQYRVRLNYSNGAEGPLPDNFVDPWYEMFIGEVVPLKCLGEQWTTTIGGSGNNWIVGVLDGDSAGADPPTGFDDGTHLYQAGAYSPGSNTTISFDAVDTLGYANVRLQYYRWLTVEDGFFDSATILADSVPVWSNYASAEETGASFAHIDKEWRFHDVDLSAHVADGVVAVAFALASDQGLEFGGWTAGALCIVAFDDGLVTCGNGVIDGAEGCDDGNLASGDGCSASCTVEGDTGDPTAGTSDSGGGGEGESGDEETDGDTDDADFDAAARARPRAAVVQRRSSPSCCSACSVDAVAAQRLRRRPSRTRSNIAAGGGAAVRQPQPLRSPASPKLGGNPSEDSLASPEDPVVVSRSSSPVLDPPEESSSPPLVLVESPPLPSSPADGTKVKRIASKAMRRSSVSMFSPVASPSSTPCPSGAENEKVPSGCQPFATAWLTAISLAPASWCTR